MIWLDRSSGAASTNRVLTPLLMLLAIAVSPVGAEVIVGKNALLDGANRNGNIIGGGQPTLTGPAFIEKSNIDAVAEYAKNGTR